MCWRLKNSEYQKNQGTGNKKKMLKLVKRKNPIGILAYLKNIPIGWCSVSPRKNLVRLETSRVLTKVDEKEVWSINCFFIKKEFRNKKITNDLIVQAIKFAKKHGAKILEAYPLDVKRKDYPQVFAFTGFKNPFIKNGFTEVARRTKNKPILRREI